MNSHEFNHQIDNTPDDIQFNYDEAKEAVRAGQNIKEYANLINARSNGPNSGELNETLDQTHYLAEDLYEKNKDWVDGYLDKVEELYPETSEKEVKDSYFTGLDRFIKRQYRTFKKESPAELSNLNDNQYLKNIIFTFTHDYIQLAKLAQRTTESSNTALSIATNANLISPTEFRNILDKYDNLGNRAINKAIVNYPFNPEKFLDGVIETTKRLKSDPIYADLGNAVIDSAAISYPSNPKGFLDNVIETTERLKSDPKYSEMGNKVINTAAVSYLSNPEKFLDEVIETTKRLKSDPRYADLGNRAINDAAVGYPSNPEKFLDGVIETTKRLKSDPKYADLGNAAISSAAISYPSNPEKFLDEVIKTAERLKTNPSYSDLGNWVIDSAAVGYPSNPEKFLDGVIETTKRLRADQRYSMLGDWAINSAAIDRPSNPEKFLDEMIAKREVEKIYRIR